MSLQCNDPWIPHETSGSRNTSNQSHPRCGNSIQRNPDSCRVQASNGEEARRTRAMRPTSAGIRATLASNNPLFLVTEFAPDS
ncbi:hypothetical protein PCANC_15753 [Puccinia coronata f. sp. avenae]|uniref:Uncharacterized protein n=1 Tax=Puccinia coronata f. sp. avenae TaxID=200324 RepID=A0A2N5TUX8_9BASI|nr:hypothetical protein PCANC_17613 [Puccinia coronata f. sp. avenae]PLW12643.1 hypothetical protein PCASD_16199 [Puccinia coronata f. sp. avenae]PLW29248.1 hypothetical protein PCANC_15753 [Puccinia coronata f. sp. avenae]PLW35197.1 hypothetical protein PCASD_08587 [Puccinia coronata f. sp. avenae]